MPAYCFTCPDCNADFERIAPVSKARTTVACTVCGGKALRDYVREHHGVAHKPGNWPMVSDAAGVHPDQVVEAAQEAEKRGVPTEFNSSGQAVFTSPLHRKRFCEAHGMYDKNGGYSDPRRGAPSRLREELTRGER